MPVSFPPQPGKANQLAVSSDGTNFLALWQYTSDLASFPQHLNAARISPDGFIAQVYETDINPASYPSNPTVTFDGKAYAIAQEVSVPGVAPVIVGWRLTPGGKPAAGSAELISGRQNRQSIQAATATPTGYAVAWYDNPNGANGLNQIKLAVFGENGQLPSNPRSLASRAIPPVHIAIASSSSNILAVWVEPNATTGNVKTYSQLLNLDGSPSGDLVTLFDNGGSTALRLVAGTDGWLLVDQVNTGIRVNPSVIRAYRLNADGTLAEPVGIQLSPMQPSAPPVGPAVAFNGQEYLIAWSGGGFSSELFGSRISTDGHVLDPGGKLITSKTGATAGAPALASDGTNFFMVWEQKESNGTANNTRGILITPDFQTSSTNGLLIGTGSNQLRPSVASNGYHYWVTWQQERTAGNKTVQYLAQALIHASGNLAGGPRQLLPSESPDELNPVAAGRPGSFLAAYLWQDDIQDSRIRVVRYSDLAPLIEANRLGSPIAAGSPATAITPDALLIAGSLRTFNGGWISATLGSNSPPDTQLSLLTDATPTQTVTVDGNIVGAAEGPVGELLIGTNSLTIQFNSQVSPNSVQTLLRHMAIQTADAASGTMLPDATATLTVTSPDGFSAPPVQIDRPVVTIPTITNIVGKIEVVAGTPTVLAPVATGGALTYRWFLDGVPYSAANRQSLSLSLLSKSRGGSYSLVVSNAAGSVSNWIADVQVLPNPPTVTVPPVAQDAIEGSPVFFRVEANSYPPYQYQWLHDGTNLPNAISPFLRLVPPAVWGGDYQVMVSNPSSATMTEPVSLHLTSGTTPLQLQWARTWGNTGAAILHFDRSVAQSMADQRLSVHFTPETNVTRLILDPADERQLTVLAALDTNLNYIVWVTEIVPQAGGFVTNTLSAPIDRRTFNQTMLGALVSGFQDDFDSVEEDPHWNLALSPPMQNWGVFKQHDGVMSISGASSDPNHLLFVAPAYDPDRQDVLARVRITGFEAGDSPRAGIAASVIRGYSQGANFLARRPSVNTTGFQLLEDQVAWSPAINTSWATNAWYWMRLHRQLAPNSSAAVLAAKVWPADGSAPEPAIWNVWQVSPLTPSPSASAYAGLTASSFGTDVHMDVDYILISADGLPVIQVAPSAFTPTLRLAGIGPDGTITLSVAGLSGATAQIQKSSDLNTWTDLDTMTLGDSPIEISDTVPASESGRFYRVLIQ